MHPSKIPAIDDKTPDSELVRRVASKDHEAFRVLMRRHNQMLYRAARSILKNEAEAEDAVQEAYLQAYRAMGLFRSKSETYAEADIAADIERGLVARYLARVLERGDLPLRGLLGVLYWMNERRGFMSFTIDESDAFGARAATHASMSWATVRESSKRRRSPLMVRAITRSSRDVDTIGAILARAPARHPSVRCRRSRRSA